jgi:hypothetical protein
MALACPSGTPQGTHGAHLAVLAIDAFLDFASARIAIAVHRQKRCVECGVANLSATQNAADRNFFKPLLGNAAGL